MRFEDENSYDQFSADTHEADTVPERVIFSEREHKYRGIDTAVSVQSPDADEVMPSSLEQLFQDYKHPILTYRAQQLLFRMGEIGERGNVPISLVVRHSDFPQVLDTFTENDRELFLQMTDESGNLADLLVHANIRLAIRESRRFLDRGLPRDELIQEGILGLYRGVERFDPDKKADETKPDGKNVNFSTFGIHWVRQAMKRAVEDKGRGVRIPAHLLTSLNKSRSVQLRHEDAEQRILSQAELAEILEEELGVKKNKAQKLAFEVRHGGFSSDIRSLDVPISHEDDYSLAESIPDAGDTYEEIITTIDQQVVSQTLRNVLNELSHDVDPRVLEVIKLRYGIIDGVPRTLKEACEETGVSRYIVETGQKQLFNRLRESEKLALLAKDL